MSSPGSNIPAQKQQAIACLQSGRLPEAQTRCEELLRLTPQDPEVWLMLAAIHLQRGVFPAAVEAGERALALQPANPEIHNLLGYAWQQQREWDQASACYREALRLRPDYSDALNNLGNTCLPQDKPEEAIHCFQEAVRNDPDFALAHYNLGSVLGKQGRRAEAIAAYRRAIQIAPGFAEAHNSLGHALEEQGDREAAAVSYREALRLNPNLAEAHNNLGNVFLNQGRTEEALRHYRRALELAPSFALAYYNLGNALNQQGKVDAAVESFRQAVRFAPDFVEAHHNLGCALQFQNNLEEAIACFRTALRLSPDFVRSYNDLANTLNSQGLHKEAEASYQQALRIKPEFSEARSNLLFCLNYHPSDPRALLEEHRRWGEIHRHSLTRVTTPSSPPDPERRLKVGYVSPDLRAHSVAFFFEPLLAHHDPARVEAFCYANVDHPDNITAHFRAIAPHWRDIHGLSDEQAAALIRQDGIDILVDLAGHTQGHRLPVFARKPAPIQVTYLGYPNTTGLTTIDYRFTDALADPPGETEQFHTEQLVRLPHGFLCFRAPDDAPPPTPPPCLTAGHITFGSFNNLAKVTPEAVADWTQLLHAVPGARLILKNKSLHDTSTVTRFQTLFAGHGIGPERLELLGYLPRVEDHLTLYGRIDIALDTFPYNGTTTTCQALWMGVPVITLAGQTHAGRVGVSLLTQVGLAEFIASDREDYIAQSVALARDPDRLTQRRSTLRAQMQVSPLCDGPSFARDVEAAYRTMWRGWCATSPCATSPRA